MRYEQRVLEIEHASFVPFVMLCTGGAGSCATVVLKRLGALLAKKHNSYSTLMGLLRCRLNFALLRASVMCLHGSRSLFRCSGRFDMAAADLALTEGRVFPCKRDPTTLLTTSTPNFAVIHFPFLAFCYLHYFIKFSIYLKIYNKIFF